MPCAVAFFAVPATAQAPKAGDAPLHEGDEEIIVDPELSNTQPAEGTTPSAEGTTAPSEGGEEVIVDPELSKVKPVQKTPPSTPAALSQPWSDVRLVLRTRIGIDTAWERPREDVLEATEIAVLEAEHHRSESVGFAVGLRARHAFGARGPDAPKEGANRYQFDIAPTAGYADLALADEAHLRVGYQVISLGRFDAWSALNFLAVYDLRSGPVTMPEAMNVAQPALRLDLEPSSWFTLSAYYVPFFQPHMVDMYGTDYAVLDILDRTNPLRGNALRNVEADVDRAKLSRSGIGAGANGVASAFVPEASGRYPQVAARSTVRSATTEFSVTGGTALEHLPTPILPDADIATDDSATVPHVVFNRFYVVGADGAVGVGPFQFGAELAYVFDRTLLTASLDDNRILGAGQTDLVHVGLRGELLETDVWLMAAEGFVEYTLDDPPQDPLTLPHGWAGLESGNRTEGAVFALRYSPEGSGLTLEGAIVALTGPSYVFLPRIEYEATEGFYLELGAAIVEGTTVANTPGAPLGAILDDVDQVFVGVKYLP